MPIRVRGTSIRVDDGFFPAPAAKLVITQVLESSRDPPYWAWIIVAAFYDSDGAPIWSTKVIAGQSASDLRDSNDGSDEDALNPQYSPPSTSGPFTSKLS